MKLLCFLLCITYVSCFYTEISPSDKQKIVNGKAARPADVPCYAVLVFMGYFWFGGAVIISPDWLLSAEILFLVNANYTKELKVKTGSVDREDVNKLHDVEVIIKYSQEFPFTDAQTNLALIKLSKSLELDRFQNSIAISSSMVAIRPRRKMQVSGFGKIHRTMPEISRFLKMTEVEVLDRQDCPEHSERMFCAHSPGKGPCVGDEGGPGIINGELVAIITKKPRCGEEPRNAYTKVGPFYEWIVEKTGLRL